MTADTITPPPSGPVGWPFSAIVPVLWVVLALTMLAFIAFGLTAVIEKFRRSAGGPEAVRQMVRALLASVLVFVALAIVQAMR